MCISRDILSAQVIVLLKTLSLFHLRQRVDRISQRIVLLIDLTSIAIAHAIVFRLIRHILTNRITSGIVEHHDIVEFHLTQSRHTTVFPVRPFNIRLQIANGQRMLRQGHSQRRLRNTRAVAHLTHKEVITREQRLLQRRRRNHVVLEEELVDEIDSHQCKDDRVDPRHHRSHRALIVLPPFPVYFL